MQGTYAGYDQSYGGYGSGAQGSVPAAVADAAQSLPAESQQKLANIVAKVPASLPHSGAAHAGLPRSIDAAVLEKLWLTVSLS